MDDVIKDLTLLLLYLTSWQEGRSSIKAQRSWKGHPSEVLDELTEDGYIDSSKGAKSVYLTEEGIKKARELMEKYIRTN